MGMTEQKDWIDTGIMVDTNGGLRVATYNAVRNIKILRVIGDFGIMVPDENNPGCLRILTKEEMDGAGNA